jgi:hypothetical protein
MRFARALRLLGRKERFLKKSTLVEGAGVDHRYSPSWVHAQIAEKKQPLLAFRPGSAVKWRSEARETLRDLVGWESPSNLGVPKLLWSAEDRRGTYEKILINGELGSRIPLYRCIPTKRRKSQAWVICIQGHTSGMHNSIGADVTETFTIEPPPGRNLAKWCFDNGFAAICLEQRSLGERGETIQEKRAPHSCHDAAMRALLFGRTIMGERLLDVRLVLNFINQFCISDDCRGPVGILGNSLGGTVAVYANSLIDEIDFAVAGSCLSTIDESIAKIYHCSDLYIPNLRKYFEFGEIAGLAAPKPLVVVQGKRDPIFPIKGMRTAAKRIDQIYRSFGAGENFIVKVGEDGHRFYQRLAAEAVGELGDSI